MRNKILALLLGMALPLLAYAGLETGTYISDLVITNPTGSDNYATADDHIRLLKTTIKNTFPNINNAVTLTDEQLNTGIALLGSSNTFTGNDQTISSSSPSWRLISTGAAADQKRWRILGGSTGVLSIDTLTDANGFGQNFIVANRTGTVIDSASITATAINLLGGVTTPNTFQVTGPSSQVINAGARFLLSETDQVANEKIWDWGGISGDLLYRTRTDADGAGATYWTIQRTGTAIDKLLWSTSTTTMNLGATSLSAVAGVELGQHLLITDANPSFYIQESDAGADEKVWRWTPQAGDLQLQARTDVNGTGTTPINIQRTGTVIDTIAFASTALTWNANTLFTTANDGSGSGLDADLLDGITSANFAQLGGTQNVTGTWTFTTGVPAFNGGTSGASAPFSVDSTFLVTNLNAEFLGGNNSSFYRDMGNANAGTLAVARGGTGTTTSTGTGSTVLSASPTFTGTLTAATVAATTVTGDGSGLTNLDAADVTAVPSTGVISSGTYTPSVTCGLNCDAVSAHTTQYIRIGTIVNVAGIVEVDPTAAASGTTVRVSLPVSSDIVNVFDLAGSGMWSGGGSSGPTTIYGQTSTNDAVLDFVSNGGTVSRSLTFTFQYRIQ